MRRKQAKAVIGTFQRDLQLGRHWEESRADGEGMDRFVEISFSSEEPYLRCGWFEDWVEILDHGKASVRLDRIRTAGISLFNHDVDQPVAKPARVWIEDRRGKAILRFGRTARADEIWTLISDGILTNTSVWYRIYKRELEVEEEGKPAVYRVTDWEPMELGPVSVGADATVGVGRGSGMVEPDDEYECVTLGREEEKDMACQKCGKDPCACSGTPAVAVIDRDTVLGEERQRAAQITAIGLKWNEQGLAADAVARGVPLESFREQILERLEKRNGKPATEVLPNQPARVLGMGRREVQGFSFMRLLNHLANPLSRTAAEAAGMEIEACQAWAAIAGLRAGAVAIPPDVYRLPRRHSGQRTISDTTEGGDMTPTVHMGAQFIDVLRATRPVMARATILGGLTGDLLIPKQTAATSASFKAEGTAGDETTPTYEQVSLTPHKLTAWTEPTKQALMQFSPDLEALLRADLFNAAMSKVEAVLIDGGDTAEPDGLLDITGAGSVSASDAKLTWDNVCDLEGEVDTDNALEGDLCYVTNAKVKSQMKRTEISTTSSGQFIFDRQSPATPVNGYPLLTTNHVPRTLGGGGNLSACIFGNLAEILIGIWENVEILVNPYSKDKEGVVRVTLYHWVDFGFRHEESFATCVDIDPTAV